MLLRALLKGLSISSLLTVCCFGQKSIPSSDSGAVSAKNADAFSEYIMTAKISDQVANYKGSGPLTIVGPNPSSAHRKAWDGPFPEVNLPSLSANSDLVIEGIPQTQISGICAAGTFVCSDFEVYVTKIIKNTRMPVIAGQTIVVARAGGTIKVGGVVVQGVEPNFRAYRLGDKYILFLTFITQSGSFKAYPGSSFQEVDGKIIDSRINFGIRPADRDLFFEELSHAIAVPHLEAK